MDKTRKISLDVLRIIAALSVVSLHVCARYSMIYPVASDGFRISNFINSLSRFGVPVFVMISGALFLNSEQELDTKHLWLHNILRIFIVYIVWGFAYYVFQSVYLWRFPFWKQGFVRTVTGIAYGSDHLWFLGMIIGLYALVPVLRVWLSKANRQNIEYFLIIFFIFQIVRTTVEQLMRSSLVSRISGMAKISEITGYLGYFVMGYFLYEYEVPKRLRYCIYGSLPVCIAVNYIVSWKFSIDENTYNPGIYDSFGLFTFIEAVALFLFVTRLLKNARPGRFVVGLLKGLAADTFGVYLIHVMILDYMLNEGWFDYAFPVALWQVIITFGVFFAASLVSAVIRRIPFIGRFLA